MIGLGISIPKIAINSEGGSLASLISSLFKNNEPGVWYDPSDMSTMFQDAAGTTPVTAVEQPVGLILDKSKGLVLGPELIPNGDFSSSTGWALSTGVTISNGVCTFTNVAGGNSGAVRLGLLTTGKRYRVTVTVLAVSGGPIYCFFAGSESPIISSPGTYTFDVSAGSTTTNFGVVLKLAGPVNAVIDNVSVKEVLGNHATQTTSISRPVLSARVNLLTKTEQFGSSSWTKFTTGSSTVLVTDNFGIAPDGTQTATRLQLTGSGGFAEVFQRSSAVVTGVQYRVSIWMRSLSGTQNTTIAGANPYSSLVTVTEQWQQFSIAAAAASSNFGVDIIANVIGASASLDILVWHPDLRVANTGGNLPAYQRVNTATDYDTAGFPMYLRFNGADTFLVTPSIDFTSTDKVTVFAGVRKLSDAASGFVFELSIDAAVNRAFNLNAPSTFGGSFSYRTRSTGSLSSDLTANGFNAPITNTITLIASIADDILQMRVNGSQVASSTSDQGTGNYGNYPLYIGRRGGASIPFNGHLYSLIVRGAQSREDQIIQTEKFVASKTGINYVMPTIDYLVTEDNNILNTEDSNRIII